MRTRSHLLMSAAVVFDKYGYEAAKISDILGEAGVTKGALYFHFPSKTVLAEAVVEAQTQLVAVAQHHLKMRSVIELTFSVAEKLQTSPLMRAGIRLAIERGTWQVNDKTPYLAWIGVLHSLTSQAADAGELKAGTDAQRLAEFVVGTFTGTQLLSEVLNHRTDLIGRLCFLWRVALPGTVAPGLIAELQAAVSARETASPLPGT